jgi:hypothetical protein
VKGAEWERAAADAEGGRGDEGAGRRGGGGGGGGEEEEEEEEEEGDLETSGRRRHILSESLVLVS